MECLVCSLRIGTVATEGLDRQGACWAFAVQKEALEAALSSVGCGALAGHAKTPERLASALSRELGWLADDVVKGGVGSLGAWYAGQVGMPGSAWAEAVGIKKKTLAFALGRSQSRKEDGQASEFGLAAYSVDGLSVKGEDFEGMRVKLDRRLGELRARLGGDILWSGIEPRDILGEQAQEDKDLDQRFCARIVQGLVGERTGPGARGAAAGPRL